MKLKVEPRKPNPYRKAKVINFRVNNEDLLHLEIIRRAYPNLTDSEILRAILAATSEKIARTLKA